MGLRASMKVVRGSLGRTDRKRVGVGGQVNIQMGYMGPGRDRSRVRVRFPVERKAPGSHAVVGHLRRAKNAGSAEVAEYVEALRTGYAFVMSFLGRIVINGMIVE